MPDPDKSLCVISSEVLYELLQLAANGEDPDMLLAEFYANCNVTRVEGEDNA